MNVRLLQILKLRWGCGEFTASDLRVVAGELLAEGAESPALIELFSLQEDAVAWEGPALFERALEELAAQALDDDMTSEGMAQWAAEAARHRLASPETVMSMEEFVQAVPELEPAWRAHLEEYGYPLFHLFFGSDVTRFAVRVSESGDEELRERFAAAIERLAASDDPAVVEVILVSFIEDLAWGDEGHVRALADLSSVFGPATLQRKAEFEEWAAKFEEWRRSKRAEPSEGNLAPVLRNDARKRARLRAMFRTRTTRSPVPPLWAPIEGDGEAHSCPVCGYPGLAAAPWSGEHGEQGSDEICPSCGIHLGYEDHCGGDPAARPAKYAELRAKWVEAGRPWFLPARARPADWPPPSDHTSGD